MSSTNDKRNPRKNWISIHLCEQVCMKGGRRARGGDKKIGQAASFKRFIFMLYAKSLTRILHTISDTHTDAHILTLTPPHTTTPTH